MQRSRPALQAYSKPLTPFHACGWSCLLFVAAWLALAPPGFGRQEIPFGLPLLWPEEQRAFLQDGPGWLLSDQQIEELLALDAIGREKFIFTYLQTDPIPETPANELLDGVERRLALMRREFISSIDDRARLLFLQGEPQERQLIDCGETFNPIEIWRYGTEDARQEMVLYRPKPGEPFRLWLPIDGKRALYNEEMEYLLEQWEELKGRISGGRRIDRWACKMSKEVDQATGIDGLYGFRQKRPKNMDLQRLLEPPDDLAAWARKAAATPLLEDSSFSKVDLQLLFPERLGQRMQTRMMVVLESHDEIESFVEGEKTELRLKLEGRFERNGKVFEEFRVRFQVEKPAEELPLALVADRLLRPGEEFLLRLKVIDEVSGREHVFSRGFVVASKATPIAEGAPPEEVIMLLGEELKKNRLAGFDSILLVPPATDVVFGLWRAEALVTGQRIVSVAFLLDDAPQMTRRRPPFTAELRLETYPREQIVRVEGYDGDNVLVASDEVVLNQPRGELRVRILEPKRGNIKSGLVHVKTEVVVPEEKVVTSVELKINEEVRARLEKPPWETDLEVNIARGELTYLTAVAELDDGSRAEDVRFLNAPNYIDEVEVDLVELYTTVTDKGGQLVRGLVKEDFEVWEDRRPQELVKFELVEDLPLTLGIAIDTSGSMFQSLAEAQRAAISFLEKIITPRDRCFALAFADRPELLMERTSDVGAVAERLQDLIANGSTSLHDAVVTSLYYYRGIRGRRALILLSDGEDTSSTVAFRDALEYARRSGVSIYTIGLRIGRTDIGVRRKLENLAQETGGRTFYIKEAVELDEVYDEIEAELRSQYLLAYNSDQGGIGTEYREITLEVKGGKLQGRTIRGYYP